MNIVGYAPYHSRSTILTVLTFLTLIPCAATLALASGRSGTTHKTNLRTLGPGLSVSYASVDQVTQCLVGPGVSVSNVTLTGAARAVGTFTGGTGIIGFEDGVILGSGDVALVPGPNQADDITADNGAPGDADLDVLIPGSGTFDAAVLEFDFTCSTTATFRIEYVFTSDEYNEFVNSEFNDIFAFFLDGTAAANNIAVVPAGCSSPGIPVAINNVNCGNPFGTGGRNCDCYRNNDLNDGGGRIDTEMDGLTQVFVNTVNIAPGTHHLKIAIADVGDEILDSNVFLRCQGLDCVCPDTIPPSGVELGGECKVVNDTTLCANLTWLAPSDSSAVRNTTTDECVPIRQAAAAYDIRWSTSPIVTVADFQAANQAFGEPTPAAPGTPESFALCGLPEGTVYIALRSRDASFNVSEISTASAICPVRVSGIGMTAAVGIGEFALTKVAPNPSPGATWIEYVVPREAAIRLSVLDLQGREVAVLAHGLYRPGRYQATWSAKTGFGKAPAGLYFVRYQTPGGTLVSRMALTR